MSRRIPRSKTQRKKAATPDEIELYIRQLADEHQQEWHKALLDASPHWAFLLSLHLRLVELENMKSSVQELLP